MTFLGIGLGLGGVGAAAVFALRGDYPVRPTISDDTSLPRVQLNGATFHAETFGSPANPTILVLHGGPGDDYSYQLPLRALQDEYFVVFYDQRGSGLSARVPDAQLTLETYLTDVDAFVDAFGHGRPVHVIGHSWGGMLGTQYAARHPEKVAHLLLASPGPLTLHGRRSVDAAWGAYASDLIPAIIRTALQSLHVRGDGDARADYFSVEHRKAWFAHPANGYVCPNRTSSSAPWRLGARAADRIIEDLDRLEQRLGNPLLENVQRIQGPVSVLVGSCDRWLGRELQEQQLGFFAHAQLYEIQDVGHAMFTDDIDAVLPVMRRILAMSARPAPATH